MYETLVESYERMKPLIMRNCRNIVPQGMDFEDVWQEVLLDGIENVSRLYNPELSSLDTYVTNRAYWRVMYLRRKYRTPEVGVEDMESFAGREKCEPEFPEPRKLTAKLADMLPPSRRVLFLYKSQGMRLEDIGKRLGISKQRASQLLDSVITILRKAEGVRDHV